MCAALFVSHLDTSDFRPRPPNREYHAKITVPFLIDSLSSMLMLLTMTTDALHGRLTALVQFRHNHTLRVCDFGHPNAAMEW